MPQVVRPGGAAPPDTPPDLALSHCHGVTSSERTVVSTFVFKAVDIFISMNVEHHIKKRLRSGQCESVCCV